MCRELKPQRGRCRSRSENGAQSADVHLQASQCSSWIKRAFTSHAAHLLGVCECATPGFWCSHRVGPPAPQPKSATSHHPQKPISTGRHPVPFPIPRLPPAQASHEQTLIYFPSA